MNYILIAILHKFKLWSPLIMIKCHVKLISYSPGIKPKI